MEQLKRHSNLVLFVVALFVTAIHLMTVGHYPACWFDEIEILECGRFSLFDVPPEWSVNLIASSDGALTPPAPLFHCFSGVLLETLYRLTGNFLCGRIIMLLSLPFCAMALLAWLRTLGFPALVSLATALLLLVDPNATICAHWYRPDLWCMAMTFLSLTLIHRSHACRHPTILLLSAGGLIACSVFFWITSVLFLPLIILELWHSGNLNVKRCLWFIVGGVLTTVIILIPLYPHIPAIVNQYLTRSEVASMGGSSSGCLSRFYTRCIDFVKIALRSPFVWSTAMIGILLSKKRKMYILTFALVVAFMLATRVYHLRMVYLMPWLFLFVAEAFRSGVESKSAFLRRGVRTWILMATIAGTLISVILLNYAAWPERNTLSELVRQLHPTVPGESPRAYLYDMEHELYYAGRHLGWRLYSTNPPRNAIFDGHHNTFLKTMDAIVVSDAEKPLSDTDRIVLAEAGFSETARVTMPPAATSKLKNKIATFIYAHGYPSCTVWTRKQDSQPKNAIINTTTR